MDDGNRDDSRALVLDGNAAAGLMVEIFGVEMTASPAECSACGYTGAIGSLLAFMHTPGVILRCPACGGVMLRISVTPGAYYVDARGSASIRFARL